MSFGKSILRAQGATFGNELRDALRVYRDGNPQVRDSIAWLKKTLKTEAVLGRSRASALLLPGGALALEEKEAVHSWLIQQGIDVTCDGGDYVEVSW